MQEHGVTGRVRSHGLNLKSAIWAGIIAGAVFMMLEMLLVPLFGMGTPWAPPRMIAAIVLGSGVLMPPTFDLGVLMVAVVVHFALSIVYALLLGAVVSRLSIATSVVVGTLFGLALYVVNFYLFTAIFPWFAMARGGVSIFAHAVFGAVAGWSYKLLTEGRPKLSVVRRDQVSV
jgi:hypothetical protein